MRGIIEAQRRNENGKRFFTDWQIEAIMWEREGERAGDLADIAEGLTAHLAEQEGRDLMEISKSSGWLLA